MRTCLAIAVFALVLATSAQASTATTPRQAWTAIAACMKKHGARRVEHVYQWSGEADFGKYDAITWGYSVAGDHVLQVTGEYTSRAVARKGVPCLDAWH